MKTILEAFVAGLVLGCITISLILINAAPFIAAGLILWWIIG